MATFTGFAGVAVAAVLEITMFVFVVVLSAYLAFL